MKGGDEIEIRAASADLTPESPVPLAGFEARSGVFDRIADRLEANALRMGPVVLVSSDLLYVGEVRSAVERRLAGRIRPEHLFLAATHTHIAPATDRALAGLGVVDPAYAELAAARIAALVTETLDGPGEPARLRFAEAECDAGMNRRNQVLRPAVLPRPGWRRETRTRPNPDGPRDSRLRLLAIEGEDGAPRAVVWSFACHPVAFPDSLAVSAEFPGHVRRILRDHLGRPVPVLFLQGFAGDVRPRFTRPLRGPVERLGSLGLEERFRSPSAEEWKEWADSIAAAALAAHAAPGEPVGGPVRASRIEVPLDRLHPGAPADRTISLHRVAFGDALDILGVSAEPVAEHVGPVCRLLPGRRAMPVGYIDRVAGYLPTTEMLGEGGYEADGFRESFDLAVPVAGDPDRILADAVAALVASGGET